MRRLHWGLCLVACLATALAGTLVFAGEDSSDVVNTCFEVRGLGGGGGMFVPSVSPYDSNFMMIACDMSGSYRSVDGGKTWEMIHFTQMNRNRNSAWPAYFKDRVFWNREREISVSRDKGRTWSKTGIIPGDNKVKVNYMAAVPGTPDVLLVAATNGVWRSADDGKTWTKVITCWRSSDFVVFSDKVFIVADQNNFSVSSDTGKTWQQHTMDITKGEGVFGFAGGRDENGSVFVASAWKTGLLRSTDEGKTWAIVDKFDSQNNIRMASNQTKTIYAAQNHGQGWCKKVWASHDGGLTWSNPFRMNGADKNVEVSWVQTDLKWGYFIARYGMYASLSDPNLAMLSTQGDFYITRDGGKTWKQSMNEILGVQPGDPGRRYRCTGLEVTSCWGYYFSPWEKNREYIAYTDIGFGRTVDNGKTWIWGAKGSKWCNTFYDVAFDPEIKGKIYAACSNLHDIPHWSYVDKKQASNRWNVGGISISEDHGVTWKSIMNAGLPNKACTSVCVDPTSSKDARVLYATVYGHGVFKSIDGGKSWVKKSNGLGNLPNLHVYRIRRHPKSGNLYCLITAYKDYATFNIPGGIWKSTDGAETWVNVSQSAALVWPTNFAVDANDENVMYMTAATAPRKPQGGVWKTTDGGKTWSHILTDAMYFAKSGSSSFDHTMSFLIHPDDSNLVYAGTGDHGLWYSKDAGATWNWYKEFPFHNVQSIQVHPDDHTKLYLTTFGGGVWVGPHLPK